MIRIFLYASSNLGSMLALLSYPFVVEPRLGVTQQSEWWAIGYVGLSALMAACAFALWRSRSAGGTDAETDVNPADAARGADAATESVTAPTKSSRTARPTPAWQWMLLAFVPSSWMLGVTTFLSTDIAPVPLFWVLPLSIYLLTFILTFARRPPLKHAWMLRGFVFSLLLMLASNLFLGTWQILLIHLIAFFFGCMVCHGELAQRRPDPVRLTAFYLWISVGGMLGGLLHTVAPLLFTIPLEYPLTVAAGCLLLHSFRPEEHERSQRLQSAGRWIGAEVGMLFGLIATVGVMRSLMDFAGTDFTICSVLAAIPVLFLLYLFDRPGWFGLVMGGLLIAVSLQITFAKEILHTERSFFGLHRVIVDPDGNRRLLHGGTSHGVQSTSAGRCTPRAYYYPTGPLGDIFQAANAQAANAQAANAQAAKPDNSALPPVAIVGLGTGASICYQQPGQEFRIYEIDPVVRNIAESPEFFTYLSECSRGRYEIVLGDGRLQLERDNNREPFGLMVFDAFSSDAIPVHLLTREAVQIYLQRLRPDGMLAVHITNGLLCVPIARAPRIIDGVAGPGACTRCGRVLKPAAPRGNVRPAVAIDVTNRHAFTVSSPCGYVHDFVLPGVCGVLEQHVDLARAQDPHDDVQPAIAIDVSQLHIVDMAVGLVTKNRVNRPVGACRCAVGKRVLHPIDIRFGTPRVAIGCKHQIGIAVTVDVTQLGRTEETPYCRGQVDVVLRPRSPVVWIRWRLKPRERHSSTRMFATFENDDIGLAIAANVSGVERGHAAHVATRDIVGGRELHRCGCIRYRTCRRVSSAGCHHR